MTDPLDEAGRISITSGMARAMALHGAARQCPECKLGIPKYPGRYPGTCPRCKGVIPGPVNEGVELQPRMHRLDTLLAEDGVQRSEGPFFDDPSCSQFRLVPYDLIESYGGVEEFRVWLEGPVNENVYYRVEALDDPVMCFTFIEESQNCRVFATEDPTRYLGFDPRDEMVNEDHESTFLAEDQTWDRMTYSPGMAAARNRMIDKTHDRVAGAFIEDIRASIQRKRKTGEGPTQIRNGFRIHVGANKTRKPRMDVAMSLQNKINQRRGVRGRVDAAKKWHKSRKGQELHQALGRYNRSRSRSEAHDAALRGKLVDTLDRIRSYSAGQQRSPMHEDFGTTGNASVGGGGSGGTQIQQPTTEDHLEGILRKLIVSNDMDVLQDVHFDDRDGSMYLFFDPILMSDEMQEILQAVRKERGDIELIASPNQSLPDESEDIYSLWWVLFAPSAQGGQPDPEIYAANSDERYTKAQMVVSAPPSPPEALAQGVDISKMIKAAGEK